MPPYNVILWKTKRIRNEDRITNWSSESHDLRALLPFSVMSHCFRYFWQYFITRKREIWNWTVYLSDLDCSCKKYVNIITILRVSLLKKICKLLIFFETVNNWKKKKLRHGMIILKFTRQQNPLLQILPFFTGLITNSSQISDSDFTMFAQEIDSRNKL